jgi:hypothetical protein
MPDGLQAYARQVLQAFSTSHRFQRRSDALLRAFVSATRSARGFLFGMGTCGHAQS